ncbi:general secretion pathway protein GspB [Aquabacterium sp.]|uniref:general secretion pathway protein GspB n=1 Tax=Aquabacterium sp. TaxID=1872578 RepID=UPI003D6C9D12
MSYILDALRRADSERERGAVPSIHAPPVPPVADDPRPARGQSPVLVAVIVVLLLALAGLLAWHLMSGKDAPTHVAAGPQPVTEGASLPPPMPAQAPPQGTVQAPAMPQPAPAAEPSPAPPPLTMAPPPRAAPPIEPVQPTPLPPRPSPPRPSLATATTPAPQPEADTRVYAVHELPANIQRELPKLVVGGAMYSETPANRMLIINSQVFHEGDKLGPDLLLQEIKLKSAVFQYKGHRYGVSY